MSHLTCPLAVTVDHFCDAETCVERQPPRAAADYWIDTMIWDRMPADPGMCEELRASLALMLDRRDKAAALAASKRGG